MGLVSLDFIWELGLRNILIWLSVFSFSSGLVLFPSSQLILVAGGLVISFYEVSFFLVLILLVGFCFIGNCLLYFVAHRWGEEVVRKCLPIKRRSWNNDLLVMRYLFDRYGEAVIFIGRNLPVFHGLVSPSAGIVGVSKRKYFLYTFLGLCTWSILFIGVGVFFGTNYEYFLEKFQTFVVVVVVLFLFGGMWCFSRFYLTRVLVRAKAWDFKE